MRRRWAGAAGMAAAFLATQVVVPSARAVLRPPTVLAISAPALAAGAQFGAAVDGVGDVNGDGVSDAVIGAPGADKAYLVSGATRAIVRTIADPDGLAGTSFGAAVAGVGDVSGDGVDDVAVGAPSDPQILPLPCLDPPPCPDPQGTLGRAFVFSGATGAKIRTLTPPTEYFQLGRSLAGGADLSGDGVPDIVVGAPVLKPNKRGTVFAFSGATGAPLWSTTEPGAQPEPLASFGRAIAEIPDVTGDGRADVLVSALFASYGPALAGRAYLLSGATGAIVRTISDPAPVSNDAFGGLLSGIGDQNGDGVGDYVLGERGADKLHLYSGSSGGLIRTVAAPASAQGEGVLALAHVGDADGDGRDDLWVGIQAARHVFLLNGFGALLASAAGPSAQGTFGAAAAPIGNIGGDSGPDLVVGDPTAGGTGAAYLVHTRPNVAPKADAGADQVIECSGPGGAAATLDGSASTDADGDALTYEWRDEANAVVGTTAVVQVTVPVGARVFTLRVTDALGDSTSDSVSVTVADTRAPTVSVTVSPDHLWPPNHRLVPVAATVSASDACDPVPVVRLTSITSNEPDNGLGDGDTQGDIEGAAIGVDDRAYSLRAERSGAGSGRVYTVQYTATDASNNTTTASATVVVAKP